jgi:hypothetical protein
MLEIDIIFLKQFQFQFFCVFRLIRGSTYTRVYTVSGILFLQTYFLLLRARSLNKFRKNIIAKKNPLAEIEFLQEQNQMSEN